MSIYLLLLLIVSIPKDFSLFLELSNCLLFSMDPACITQSSLVACTSHNHLYTQATPPKSFTPPEVFAQCKKKKQWSKRLRANLYNCVDFADKLVHIIYKIKIMAKLTWKLAVLRARPVFDLLDLEVVEACLRRQPYLLSPCLPSFSSPCLRYNRRVGVAARDSTHAQ